MVIGCGHTVCERCVKTMKGVSDNRMRDAEVALYHIDSIISKKNEEQHEHFASLSEILEKMNYTPSDSQEGTAMNSIGQRRSNISQRSRLLSVFTETMQEAGDTQQSSHRVCQSICSPGIHGRREVR
jgi:arginyl-tRNA synthetase